MLRIAVNQEAGLSGVLGDISSFQTWKAAFRDMDTDDFLTISDIPAGLNMRMHVLSDTGVIFCFSAPS